MGKHSISWFEIPVSDFERAKKSYSTIEIGYMALFLDSEGNHMALHSPK